MFPRIGQRNRSHATDANAHCVLCLWVLSAAGLSACDGHSSSPQGSARDAASPTAGTGGTVADSGSAADPVVAAEDCSYVPCLASAVATVAGCRPSNTCTYQTIATGAIVRCFDNGITIIMNYPGEGMEVMGVKKDGNFCYGADFITGSALPDSTTVTYRGGDNSDMVTVWTDDAGTHVACPDSNVSFDISASGSCITAVSALGGMMPASGCLNATAGDCGY